jgi:hypothetical protein
MSINCQIDKQNVVCPYNGMLLTIKKQRSTDVTTWLDFYNMMLSKTQIQKNVYAINSIYIKCQKKASNKETN